MPLRAASRLNGSADKFEDEVGGSIREKGAHIRRLLSAPSVLRFGERPAGTVSGARGDDMLALVGVLRRDGMVEGGGMDLVGASEKVNDLSRSPLLLFFDGELDTAGSTFSLSKTSKMAGSNGLFVVEAEMLDLPLTGDFCAVKPVK